MFQGRSSVGAVRPRGDCCREREKRAADREAATSDRIGDFLPMRCWHSASTGRQRP
ncbi:hypothetical protein AB395_00004954 (plasmid) [Sinorhizobium fredii CCBAU 45436]|nr:hypothetical protein SF83666_b63390 [Sinorhizobium fredii CCBAU 83666]AWI60131.1 hypothetical protein AB395_00004954 [Sinorhizobium fredii CCBAU 45436]